MSSTSARREALTATVLGLGFCGGVLTVAADILTHTVSEHWNACTGKTPKSIGPRLGRSAMLFFALSVLFGLSRSKWALVHMIKRNHEALKPGRGLVMLFTCVTLMCGQFLGVTPHQGSYVFVSRVFNWGNRRRSYRLHAVLSFVGSWLFLYAAGHLVWVHSANDLENQRCRDSLDQMKAEHRELPQGLYSVGGALGFLASACAAAFFVMQVRRCRDKGNWKV